MSLQDCFKSILEGNRCVWHLGVGEAGCWKYISALGGKESTLSSKFEASKIPNIYTKATRWTLSRFQILKSLQWRLCEKSLFVSRESFWVSEKERWVFDFFLFWRRELFSWVCVKNEVPETIMWWTFNSFPFGGIFMRVFRPGSNLRKTFVLNPEKTYSINMITVWLCDSDSAENRRVYSWKVNRDTICQRKWTLIKRQPKISLGIFQLFLCLRAKEYL